MSLYGFLVMAFLIDVRDLRNRIPFASMQACLVARALTSKELGRIVSKYRICVSTGADKQ